MKRTILALAAATIFVVSPASAITPELVTIGGFEATRIVIAPPQTPLAHAIKQGLKAAYQRLNPTGRAYDDALQLYYLYGARYFEPLWLTQDASGKVTFSENAQKIIEVFNNAQLTGLRPADYLTDDIVVDPSSTDPVGLARLETAFSSAALRYAQDTHGGRIEPSRVSSSITIKPPKLNEAETLKNLLGASDPAAYLLGLEPKHREFVALKAALAKFYDGTAEEAISVPDGKVLRPGDADARLPVLRRRLEVAAPETDENIYDATAVAAVEAFQGSLGLVVDGIIGPATIAALNGGSATTKADVLANMERWRWLPEDLGDFMVQVNVPEFRLAIMDQGREVYTTRVVTGKKSDQTPIFSDEIEHIVVNPYWNVPSSIARKEIGPILVDNPGYIANNNMELLAGGKVIDASAVDWSSTSVNNFRIRQRPGSGNALGSIKFLFPNQHNVYLHDTPSKSLFSRSFRAYSHGCIRVQNPWEFAAALLSREPALSPASLDSQRGGSERWNNLAQHVPVHITYFTLRVDEEGNIRSFGDVYGHNAKLIQLLGE